MTLPKIFIASSSEGLDVANTLRILLHDVLRDDAVLTPWTVAFDLSAAYIESLEKAADEADFAVVVATPDDFTIQRNKQSAAPRDNVVFEIGFFMGSLGRERCFIVNDESRDVKLPSDLLGVQTASFRRSTDRNLREALDASSLSIGNRIMELGMRYKLGRDVRTMQAEIRRFCKSIEGEWWERITREGINVISFFQIELEAVINSVSLSGRSYNEEGHHVANWKSVIARVEKDQSNIQYSWQGWYTLPDLANVPFRGYGEMDFDKPLLGDTINRGGGKFWDIDEMHPEKTIVKPTQLRRVLDNDAIATMTNGNESGIRSVIVKTLLDW